MDPLTPQQDRARAAVDDGMRPDGSMLERLNHPYRNAFSGRSTSNRSFHFHPATDSHWELTCTAPDGTSKSCDVPELVEWIIKEGWAKARHFAVKEKMMPTAVRIGELRDCDGNPLDLSRPGDNRENDTDVDYPSDPPRFQLLTVEDLQVCDFSHFSPSSHSSHFVSHCSTTGCAPAMVEGW